MKRTHPLATNNICKPTKDELSDERTDWRRDLEAGVLWVREGSTRNGVPLAADFILLTQNPSGYDSLPSGPYKFPSMILAMLIANKSGSPINAKPIADRRYGDAPYASVKKPTPATKHTLR